MHHVVDVALDAAFRRYIGHGTPLAFQSLARSTERAAALSHSASSSNIARLPRQSFAPDLLFALALGFRAAAAAASDAALRQRPPRVLLRRAYPDRPSSCPIWNSMPSTTPRSWRSGRACPTAGKASGCKPALSGLLDQLIALHAGERAGPLVLHADDVSARRACRCGGGRLRLHGRAVRLPLRAAGTASQRESALLARPTSSSPAATASIEAKRASHDNIHPFPSSVDVGAFRAARGTLRLQPPDQAAIAGPVFGYYGVIDERIDLRPDRRQWRRRGRTGRS